MEASLTCAVCLSLFEEPVTLPLCSHNFCRDCVLECLASAEAARLQQQRGQGQARLARGGPGQGGGAAAGSRVSCPLCRKLCPLPRGGAAALPVNTTLAEVVKLYRSGTAGAAKAAEAEQGSATGLLSPLPLGGTCQKHPSRLVQLYCRMCRQAGCGQCVSEEHQGIFHSVNLIDTVYQEEKLTFFSSLKKLRIINEKLTNEISSHPNDTDVMLTNEAEVIALEFGEIFKTLETKKKQLLEDVENQRSKKEKEFQIWKKMKETHKKTIENFLKDCEKLVHECDPQCFLEVACGLNTRMKTQLDLMSIASGYEKPPQYIQKKMDIQPVVNEILALKLIPVDVVKDLSTAGNENSANSTVFKSNVKQWKDEKNAPSTFRPVAGQEEALADGGQICTRLMSISEMSAFQNMSHEELRYKYYMEHQKHSHELKTQTVAANKMHKCGTTEALKNKTSGVPLVSSPSKANNPEKAKMGSLQRADGLDEMSFASPGSHSIPSTDLNSSETRSDFNFFHEKKSQKISTLTLLENSDSSEIKEKQPMQSSAIIVSHGMGVNSSTLSALKQATSVPATVSGSVFNLDASAERVFVSPFAFGACNNNLPGFIRDTATVSFTKKDSKSVFPTFYPGKCDPGDKIDDQDEARFSKLNCLMRTTVSDASTSSNLRSSERKKPVFSFGLGNSGRDCFTVPGASNSVKVLPLPFFFNQAEKPCDHNAAARPGDNIVSPSQAVENSIPNPSASLEQAANTSESIAAVTSSTAEASAGVGGTDVAETPLHHGSYVFSFAKNCLQLPSPVFSFGSVVKNTSVSETSSSVLFSRSGTNKNENKKTESPDKTLLNVGKSVLSECTEEPASKQSPPKCADSFFPTISPKKVENEKANADSNSSSQPLCLTAVPVKEETASFTQLTASPNQEIKVKVEDDRVAAESSCCCYSKEEEAEAAAPQAEACFVPGTRGKAFAGGTALPVAEVRGIASDTDSDTEELSQASTSSDNSSASEYFSVAEDKISARGKPET